MAIDSATDSAVPAGGLARPNVTTEHAGRVARDRWGIDGTPCELGSQQDRNFKIAAGAASVVLKFANEASTHAEIDAQNVALGLLADGGLLVPTARASLAGETIERVDVDGVELLTRALDFVHGTPLIDIGAFGSEEASRLGDTAGRVAAALAGFVHEGAERDSQWNLRVAGEVVGDLVHHVPQSWRREALMAARDAALDRLEPVATLLPEQVIHADVTDDNVVVSPDGRLGVIDFGDLQVGWRVAELAATAAAVFAHDVPDPAALLVDVVRAFSMHVTLTDAELKALWPLVVLRTAVLVVSGEEQVTLDEGNDYADVRRATEWRSFQVASVLEAIEMETLIRSAAAEAAEAAGTDEVGEDDADGGETGEDASGDAAPRMPELGRLLPNGLELDVLDLSVTSPLLDAGAWLEPEIEERILQEGAGEGAEARGAVTRWGEYRLTRTRTRVPRGTSATFALGVQVQLPPGTLLVAPFDGEVVGEDGGSVVLVASGGAITLYLDDAVVHVRGAVRRGDVFGSSRTGADGGDPSGTAVASVRLQLSTVPGIRPPFAVTPHAEAQWRAISPDPSALLGVDVAAPATDPEALLERRGASFARVQEHYYRTPPQIERGWREHLVDSTAQAYVDVVNNVTTVGHSHPRLVEAAARQWALLNTNSRFHYAAATELSERLAALAPDGLDTVFLVNSGSEAVDLALRLAMTATGRPRILAAREAYHGWTLGADAVTTSLGDNPRALESRPGWVELIDAPNSVRGTHRGSDAGPAYLADLDAQLESWGKKARKQLAGVILEPIFGNGGGVLLPDGYLAGVYERVRALGGVCISDEVQVGYGRLGDWFWGFEQQSTDEHRVVPDIITIAKAMGNGQPLGAVITTKAIAEAFAAEGSFFSSAGGSPVSARIGTTVLEIMADERLQENAATVGERMRGALTALADEHPSIGAVHGHGLYLGVELVSDRESFAPATELADRVCEAMLEEGIVVQPTGDHKNVLKVKPPLCIDDASTDAAVAALDRVLTALSA